MWIRGQEATEINFNNNNLYYVIIKEINTNE